MSNNNSAAGFFILLGVLGVGIFLASRGGNKSPSHQYSHAEPAAGGWELVSRPSGTVTYENTEVTKITWSEDGLPIEITTKRHVERLP